jgi:hypothetical protein
MRNLKGHETASDLIGIGLLLGLRCGLCRRKFIVGPESIRDGKVPVSKLQLRCSSCGHDLCEASAVEPAEAEAFLAGDLARGSV